MEKYKQLSFHFNSILGIHDLSIKPSRRLNDKCQELANGDQVFTLGFPWSSQGIQALLSILEKIKPLPAAVVFDSNVRAVKNNKTQKEIKTKLKGYIPKQNIIFIP